MLARIIGLETAEISPAHVARVLLRPFLLPLVLGMLFRLISTPWAEKIGAPLLKIGSASMALSILTAMILNFSLVFDIDFRSILAFAAFTLTALVAGHLLGGPEPSNRNSLAVACASRHIGLGLLIAANARGPHTLPLVAAYLISSTIVIIFYVKWVKNNKQRTHEATSA